MLECAPKILRDALILQISLSVQILGLHVGYTFVLCAAHKNHVCTEELILVNTDKVADLDVAPGHFLESIGVFTVNRADSIVLIGVLAMPHVVFIAVFDHGDSHDEEQGRQHGWLTSRNRHNFDRLQHSDEHEVDVGRFRTLLEKIDRQESEYIVLAGAHNVILYSRIHSQLLELAWIHRNGATRLFFAQSHHFLHGGEALRDTLRNACHFLELKILIVGYNKKLIYRLSKKTLISSS